MSGPDFVDAYDRNFERVYGYLAFHLRSREEAEDLTQLTFERALRSWHRYDEGRASVATWLLAIARNSLVDQRRRRGSGRERTVAPATIAEVAPAQSGPEESSLGPSPEVEAALSSLRRRDREVIALRFGADLRAAEIAELLDLSVANVQQILSRALRKLRATLEDEPGAKLGGEGPGAGEAERGDGEEEGPAAGVGGDREPNPPRSP